MLINSVKLSLQNGFSLSNLNKNKALNESSKKNKSAELSSYPSNYYVSFSGGRSINFDELEKKKNKIIELYYSRKSCRQAASELELKEYLLRRAWKYLIPPNTEERAEGFEHTERCKDLFLSYYRQGLSTIEIAFELKEKEACIKSALERWGEPNPYEVIEKQKDEIISLYRAGCEPYIISDKTNFKTGLIIRALKNWGEFITPEDAVKSNKDKIIELYKKGEGICDISYKISRGVKTADISRALIEWGVKKPQASTIENKDKILELRQQGKNYKDIARELGFSEKGQAVSRAVKRWKEDEEIRKQIDAVKDKIIEMHDSGKSRYDIFKELEIPAYYVRIAVEETEAARRKELENALIAKTMQGQPLNKTADELNIDFNKAFEFLAERAAESIKQTAEKKVQIIEMHNSGKKMYEIAAELNCSLDETAEVIAEYSRQE